MREGTYIARGSKVRGHVYSARAARCEGGRKGTPLLYHENRLARHVYSRGVPLRPPSALGLECGRPRRWVVVRSQAWGANNAPYLFSYCLMSLSTMLPISCQM